MDVEVVKVVAGTISQRAGFRLQQTAEDDWQVTVILHHDEAERDEVLGDSSASEGEALAFVHHHLWQHFLDFSLEELAGEEVAWHVNTRPDTPQDLLDLAGLIIAEVDEYLAEEIEELEVAERRQRGEPISYGLLDYATGVVTSLHTEYPGRGGQPTRIVSVDGTMEEMREARSRESDTRRSRRRLR